MRLCFTMVCLLCGVAVFPAISCGENPNHNPEDASTDVDADSDSDTDVDTDTDTDCVPTDECVFTSCHENDLWCFDDCDEPNHKQEDCGLNDCVDGACETTGPDECVMQPDSGLCWRICPAGQSWNGSWCEGSTEHDDWQVMIQMCADLGLGYRIPTFAELTGILDDCEPQVSSMQPGECSNCEHSDDCNAMFGYDVYNYWVLEEDAVDPTLAWTVHLYTGEVSTEQKDFYAWARCVKE